jgi:hypothetical protein
MPGREPKSRVCDRIFHMKRMEISAEARARREAGLRDIRAAQAGVRYIGPLPRPSAEQEEQWIADVSMLRNSNGGRSGTTAEAAGA